MAAAQQIISSRTIDSVIVGLGATGLAVVRYLHNRGESLFVIDSRDFPPALEQLQQEFPEVGYHCGSLDVPQLTAAGRVILSPGVAPDDEVLQSVAAAGIELLGDIEIFCHVAAAPIVAVTGANGKTTVTSLLGEMIAAAGNRVEVGGNIGTPALELLQHPVPDFYLLELSSFQLEVTSSLNAVAAVVLNVTADHLDRHHDLDRYSQIKSTIYSGNGVMVVNRDDPCVVMMAKSDRHLLSFGLSLPTTTSDWGVVEESGREWIVRGKQQVMATSDITLTGRHNIANTLAAFAMGDAIGLGITAMSRAVKAFRGLPHRSQFVAEVTGVNWYNDSKGTNVGATVAALNGMAEQRTVLIAGGEGKGADFLPLRQVVEARGRAVILIGVDAPLIHKAIGDKVIVKYAASMAEAVAAAAELAVAGDAVLLSPACASFDMFSNYIERGDAFIVAVRGLSL